MHFSWRDACNLNPKYEGYDLVLAANLLDRLRDPRRFLDEIASRIRPDGILLLASPYTWLEEFTPKENWLGGVRENGEALTTYGALKRVLSASFRGAGGAAGSALCPIPARKYQYVQSHMTIWRRR